MDLDPRRLHILRAVAMRGGVTDAARLLNLTPSAVSQQLSQLELEVGIALINRTQRRVTLTAAGKMLALRAERIEQELTEAKLELTALSGSVKGSVTIAGFETAIRYLLVPTFSILARTHPDLHPHVIEEVDEAKAIRELRTGGMDMLITEREDHHPEPNYHNLAINALMDDDYRIVVPTAWEPTPNSIRDLEDLPWVVGPPESACGQALLRLTEKYSFKPRCDHVCNEFPTMLSLVSANLGAAILPTLALGGINSESITITPISTSCARKLSVVYRAPRFSPEPTVAAVVTALEEAVRGMGFTPVKSSFPSEK
jgi:DNA-binding transcriptional LysR family regulator